ncbi:MAG TPA: phBC6A51 family helix-turn-helix protein [Bacteroidia bacterium]|jgi:hypothetical protein|nr:phBC6A51 family helix-turn-helix protein [Bacteroidia bacterium]
MSKNSAMETAMQKKAMIDALEANFGSVTKSAKEVKIDPRTHYRWLREDREYAELAEDMRDISFRKVKDTLFQKALTMIEKGDASVLNKMLTIYFKNVPEEMKIAARNHNVLPKVSIKWVSTPQDPRREGYVKPE